MTFMTGRYLGKYEIQSEIGRGGMGIVYRGFDTVLQRPVAVKVLPPALAVDQDFVRRFQREAILAARLHHPNIVIVHDVGEQNGIHYIVMDYLSGQTLDTWMQQQGPMPAASALRVVQQVADALDYAHEQGVIHRDIKPSNIMLGPTGHVTLMDFGLVRATEGTGVTRSGILIGTPEYMAPEQIMGQPADRRTDVYAFGVVVYQLLTGQVPFPRTTPPAIFHAHVYESPPPPHTLRADLSPAVEAVTLKALAKQPEQRYAQAGALAADFAAAVGGKTPAGVVLAAAAAPATAQSSAPPSPPPRRAGTPPPASAGPLPAPTPASSAPRRRSWLPLLIGLTAGALVMVAAALVLTLGRGQPSATVGSVPSSPTPVARPTTAAVLVPVATQPATPLPAPTRTPTPLRTARPTEPPAPTATATAVPTATPTAPPPTTPPTTPPRPTTPPTPARPGLVLDGEQDLAWRRGDQPYGTLSRSREQVYAGQGAWKLDYDFPAVAGNFVVWQLRPAARLASQATGLTAWVYGDGSGHFLNAWLSDANGEVRAYTFGRINHQGWQQMTAWFDDQAGWPNGHISGPDNGQLDSPAALYGLVLDGVPDGQASRGAVYLDELLITQAPPPVAAPTTSPPATATSGARAPAVPVARGLAVSAVFLLLACGLSYGFTSGFVVRCLRWWKG